MLGVGFEHTLDDAPWLTLKIALVFLRQHLGAFNAHIVIGSQRERLFKRLISWLITPQSPLDTPKHHPTFGVIGVFGQALAQLIGHGLEFFNGNLLVTTDLVGQQGIDADRRSYPKIHAK